MKKLLIIGSIIVVLFAAIIVLTNVSNKSKLANAKDLYGDKELKQETIDQLDDKNYQNIMLPDELEKKNQGWRRCKCLFLQSNMYAL